jgi:activating signal cointegrator complex subunit 3
MKAVYIAPLKALVRERMADWRAKFVEGLGLRMQELTGDVTPDGRALASAHILATTPEKWDGVSRHWQQRGYVRQVRYIDTL